MSAKVNTYKIAKNIKFAALKIIEDCDEFDFNVNELKDMDMILESCDNIIEDMKAITRLVSLISDEMNMGVSMVLDKM